VLGTLKTQRVAIVTTIAVVMATVLWAASNDTTADHVLAQGDFTHIGPNHFDGRQVSGPGAVAIDRSVMPNRLYVADSTNGRVLGWANAEAFKNGDPADLVIGAPDLQTRGSCLPMTASSLCSPGALTVDSAGNLYVGDTGNNRVLEFDSPFTTDTVADRVFGTTGSFTASLCPSPPASTAADLCFPDGIALDASGNLWIADSGNNRIVEYDAPIASGASPSRVFGQGSFSSNACGNSNAAFCAPSGLTFDSSGNLYVADAANNRVLEFDKPLSTDSIADRIFGPLANPRGIAIDSMGNLYVAVHDESRVLEFDSPLTTDTTPDRVFGQPSLGSGMFCNQSGAAPEFTTARADTLCLPSGVARDSGDNIFVADTFNDRIVEYDSPLTTDTIGDHVLGQFDLSHRIFVSPNGVGLAFGLALDESVTPNHLYLVDSSNNRVLGWQDAFSVLDGGPPDIVIGQATFIDGNCNRFQSAEADTLCDPLGAAVDGPAICMSSISATIESLNTTRPSQKMPSPIEYLDRTAALPLQDVWRPDQTRFAHPLG
jgi:sugar lactone lactonase YvrE